MNKARRRTLRQVTETLGEMVAVVEEIAGEEQDAFDNLPEGIQYSDRGERIGAAAERLNELVDELEGTISGIEEVIDGEV